MSQQLISENSGITQFGGFWIRVGAYLIDLVVLIIPVLLVSFLFGFISIEADETGQVRNVGIMASIPSLVIFWIYFSVLHSSEWQASVGKKALGLKVSDKYGNRISFGRATVRYFATILSGWIFLIGYMMVGWTKNKQGLHDMIVETYVVRSENA